MGKNRTASKNILQTLVTERYVQKVNKAAQDQFMDSNGVPLIGQDHRRQESTFQVTLSKAKIENLMKAKKSKAGMLSLDNGGTVMVYDANLVDKEVCEADRAYFAGKNGKDMSECNCSTKTTFAEVDKKSIGRRIFVKNLMKDKKSKGGMISLDNGTNVMIYDTNQFDMEVCEADKAYFAGKDLTFAEVDKESIGVRNAKDYLRAVTADIDPNFKEKGMDNSGMWGDVKHDVYGNILRFGACGEWFGGDQEEESNEGETLDERDDVVVARCAA